MSRHGNYDSGCIFQLIAYSLMALFVIAEMSRGIIVDNDVAIRSMEAQGYSNIKVIDKSWFAVGFQGCDSSDAAQFTVQATNPAGKPTVVYVCTGAFFKGGTIRVK